MRKLIVVGLLLFGFTAFAQLEITQLSDNTVIQDGFSVSFAETDCAPNEPCKWNFGVTNTSSNDLYVKIFVDNMVNTNGDNFQLCWGGVCLMSINLNEGYPGVATTVPAGATLDLGNYFWNQNAPTSTPMSWTFRFQAFSDAGATVPTGTPLSMTYIYDQTFNSQEVVLNKVAIYQDFNKLVVAGSPELEASLQIFDLLGKEVFSPVEISNGTATVDISGLSDQVYIVRLTGLDGVVSTRKIMIQSR